MGVVDNFSPEVLDSIRKCAIWSVSDMPDFTFDRERFTTLRVLAGYGINQFAAAAGVSSTHLSDVERGKRAPSPSFVKRLADALDVRVADLYVEFQEKVS